MTVLLPAVSCTALALCLLAVGYGLPVVVVAGVGWLVRKLPTISVRLKTRAKQATGQNIPDWGVPSILSQLGRLCGHPARRHVGQGDNDAAIL